MPRTQRQLRRLLMKVVWLVGLSMVRALSRRDNVHGEEWVCARYDVIRVMIIYLHACFMYAQVVMIGYSVAECSSH